MNQQVVILAGGESSRFFPFNQIHKSFFKIAGKTVLERTIESVKKTDPSGIILILSSKNFDQEKSICESNPIFKDIKYVSEENSLGQADAILTAKEFISGDFFVINANQFNFDEVAADFVSKQADSRDVVTLGIAETDSPSKYGMVKFNGKKIDGIVEKPEVGMEPSNMRVVGTYLFSKEFLDNLLETPLSQYSLEETLNKLAKEGKVGSVEIVQTIPSLKYPWDLLNLKDFILSRIKGDIDTSAVIEKTAILKGDQIFIGKNAQICDYSIIESPAYIGDNTVVGAYCIVRGGTVLDAGAQVERYTDVKNSVIGEDTHIHSGFVGDSVISNNARIGAEFVTANKRLDRKSVGVVVKGEKVDTGKSNIGAFVGTDVKIGIRTSTMPGAVIGQNSNIFPGLIITGTYGPGSEITK